MHLLPISERKTFIKLFCVVEDHNTRDSTKRIIRKTYGKSATKQ